MAASTIILNYSILILLINIIIFIEAEEVWNTKEEWNTKDYLRKEHSLIKPYTDDHWDFVGSTMVTGNYIRLTPDHQSRKGQIWNRAPCYVRNWELHVHFKIHGSGRDLFGDGMAIWYARDRMQLGPVFGNKDYFHGLAIFLDTYANQNGPHTHAHPYISAMINNGSLHYDHDRDGTHTELAGCESKIRASPHETYVAIRYEKNKLSISTDVEGKSGWKPCFSVEGVRLPTGYYFGATAATGELADNHDLISLKLYDLGGETVSDTEDLRAIIPSAEVFAAPRDHVDDPKVSRLTGWRLVLLIFVGIIVVGVCVIIGIVIISKQQDRRKRLY